MTRWRMMLFARARRARTFELTNSQPQRLEPQMLRHLHVWHCLPWVSTNIHMLRLYVIVCQTFQHLHKE